MEEQPSSSALYKMKTLLLKRIYILQWLPHYTKNDILADFISGLTVGLTMMPQSIAYAALAGVAPQYGLYTAFIGSITYVFFGTIKEVSIGPTSLMSILTFSYVKGASVECVILLAFIAGCVEFLMGLLGLGFLVDFISPCLTSGFTSATALIVIAAQIKNLLGIKMNSHEVIPICYETFQRFNEIKWADTALGVCSIIVLVIIKQVSSIKTSNPRTKKLLWFMSISKNATVVLVTSLIGAYLFYSSGNETAPFKLTGPVPRGMPEFSFPALTTTLGNQTVGYKEMIAHLGSGVVIVPVLAVLANIAIAKAYSADVVVDATQEMMSLGLCNMLGSFVKAMPSCGAFTRSAVASSSDVRSPLQGIYSGGVIILALSFFAPYFYFIPKSALAAVLMTAAFSLIDHQIFPILWRCNRLDFFLTLLTFLIGIWKGVEVSIAVGAALNALSLLRMWSRPKLEVDVRSIHEKDPEVLYIKPELGLFYAAADFVSESVKKAHKNNTRLPIVLDCCKFIDVDYTAAKMLETMLNTYNETDNGLYVVNINPTVMETLKKLLDEKCLRMCYTNDNIEIKPFAVKNEQEVPLLITDFGSRKSSLTHNGQRKLSAYDLE